MKTVQCSNCRHYTSPEPRFRCRAFPDGIPEAILRGKRDHSKPFPGDKGIVWDPVDRSLTRFRPEVKRPPGTEEGT